MSIPVRAINDAFSVAPQLSPDDMPAVAAAGYKSLIINRPDHESPGQPLAADVSKAALDAGLKVEYLPVVSGAMTVEDVLNFARLLEELPTPVLAFCRSGTRSTQLYMAAQQLA